MLALGEVEATVGAQATIAGMAVVSTSCCASFLDPHGRPPIIVGSSSRSRVQLRVARLLRLLRCAVLPLGECVKSERARALVRVFVSSPTSPCPTARPQQGPRPDVIESPTCWVCECECLVWQNRQKMNQSHMVAARQVTSWEMMANTWPQTSGRAVGKSSCKAGLHRRGVVVGLLP
jgi:hypothetical protein